MKKFILALAVAMLCSCEDELIASADDMLKEPAEVIIEEPIIDSADTVSDSEVPELHPITFSVTTQDYVEL